MSDTLTLKFIVCGASDTGKTALIKRFTENTFHKDLPYTIGVEFDAVTTEVEGRGVKLQIWDLAGNEIYRSIVKAHIRGALGVALVFDVTERATYDEINKWLEDVRALCEPSAAIILIGNKSDLSEKRVVTQTEAEQFARDHNLSYIETSALNGTNVREMFIKTARDASENERAKRLERERQREMEEMEKKRKIEEAQKLKNVADQGDATAQKEYAECLMNGRVVERNASEAARYFKMSGDQGNLEALFNYAILLAKGDGVEANLSEALRCIDTVAEKGPAEVKFVCGLLFADGESFIDDVKEAIPPDLKKAARYWKMAADEGHAEAQSKLDELNIDQPETNSSSEAVESVDCSTEDHVHRAPKRLSEWIVDIRDLEKVESNLASGGSATLQVFKRKGDGKLIVGKFLTIDDSGNAEIMFRREISSLAGLDHPCIVKFAGYILPCAVTDSRFLLFTEYVSGGSLSTVISHISDFPWFDSTRRAIIAVGIVLGMRYIHSLGLIHRDLKPSNVLVDENHHPQLCDFGSSRSLATEATMTGLPHVTLYYVAPELCNEDVQYDEKVDVYSFGMMLYEIVTGKLALRNLNQIQLPAFISHGKRPEIPTTVIPFTKELIESCWSQDPAQRPSFGEIYDSLQKGHFRLFEDVDCQSVSQYAQSICRFEKE